MGKGIGGAVISGLTNLIGTGMNIGATAKQNRKSRRWSEGMYDKQYRDSIAFWNMQNAYNSPEAQMQRFKDAGLNPNLIYGQGNPGNAGAISTPDIQRPEFRTPDFSGVTNLGSNVLAGYMSMELARARHDNLLADNTVKLEEAALKSAQRILTLGKGAREALDLSLERELYQTNADARRENLRQMKVNTQFQLDENERRSASNAVTIAEGVQRILNLRGVRANLIKDAELKQLDINLKRQGIQPGDAMWTRIIAQAVERYGESAGKSAAKAAVTPFWDKS